MSDKNNETHNFLALAQDQSALVDWLTVTARDWPIREELFALSKDMIEYHKLLGNKVETWKFKGYQGIKAQGFRWGRRDDTDICMLSGRDANEFWPMALQMAQNITRIDLAVTILLNSPEPDFAQGCYLTLKDAAAGSCGFKSLTFLQNNHGGQTLYVGSRASDQFGRLYDKGREDPDDSTIDPGQLWRYEVEFKAHRAKRVGEELRRRLAEPLSIPTAISQTVQIWFFSRGIPLLNVTREGDIIDLEIQARITDDAITLEWLSNQVRPSIVRLEKNGKIKDVIHALGLDKLDNWKD